MGSGACEKLAAASLLFLEIHHFEGAAFAHGTELLKIFVFFTKTCLHAAEKMCRLSKNKVEWYLRRGLTEVTYVHKIVPEDNYPNFYILYFHSKY